MKKTFNGFLRREPVLVIAVAAALLICLLVPPDREYAGYFDLRTLALLYCLMTVVAGLRTAGLFPRLAHDLCGKLADVRALGVETGDVIALEPRFTRSNGYLKSHFIDDKACAAVLLTAIRALRAAGAAPKRRVYAYFSVYEEIGHGTAWLPEGVRDILALDIAPTGPDQTSDEHKVSIFAKDSRFPYHRGMTRELRETAAEAGADFVMDIFTPHYGTDCDGAVLAGCDVRHAAVGPGTANSHGSERTHIDGLRNTFLLLTAYLLR